ncbi:MAG TPA: TIGR02281 family clan AA aspartic protease [Burkholderiales bacterium]
MLRHFIALFVLLACGVAQAAELALIGIIGDTAAVIAIDGGEPRTIRAGQTRHGVTVHSVERERATIEFEGKKRVLALGQHYRSGAAPAVGRSMVTLAADSSGHFIAEGLVNGSSVRFVVDTGATGVVLPAADARRLGIDYRKGERGQSKTAGGVVPVFRITLNRVRVGDIELSNVEGVVIEQGLDIALLGMSFLNRVDMKHDGRTMTLMRRF